jgi:hypothetical protein
MPLEGSARHSFGESYAICLLALGFLGIMCSAYYLLAFITTIFAIKCTYALEFLFICKLFNFR